MPDRKWAYDKQSLIMICLSEEEESENRLNRMLNTLLSPKLNVADKKEKLRTEYGISMKKTMEEEVNLMCNLSEWVEELGAERGREEEREIVALKMLQRKTYGDSEILFLSGVSADRLEKLKECVL